MEFRIRKLFKPLAHLLALLLESRKTSIKTLVVLSYTIAFIAAAIFYLSSNFFISVASLAVAAGVFFSGLLDEILRELSLLKKKLGAGEKALLILDKYTDAIIIFGALYYLGDRSYRFGAASMGVSLEEHLFLGIALLFGAAMLEVTDRMILKERLSYGLETRAERMFLLATFLAVGIYLDLFEEALFAGIAAVALFIYLSVLGNLLKLYAPELLHVISGAFRAARGMPAMAKRLLVAIYSGTAALAGGIKKAISALSAKRIEEQEPVIEEAPPKREAGRAEGPFYNFTVVVMDEKLDKPLPNARVTVQSKETGRLDTRRTDSYGRSDFRVAEGQYKILVEADGFQNEEYERYIALDSGEIFALSKRSIDLSVAVSDAATAAPLKGAAVRLMQGDEEKLAKETDNLGAAYFENLEMGEYRVAVEAQGYEPHEESVEVRGEKMLAVSLKRVQAPLQKRSRARKAELIREMEEEEERKKVNAALQEIRPEEPEEKPREIASMLVEHASADKVEAVVLEIAREYLRNGGEVFIVATHPRVSSYQKALEVEIKDARARVISLATSSTSALPSEKISELPMTNLEYFKAILEEMPRGSMLIFEPISALILNIGYSAACKFLSEATEQLSRRSHYLVGFVNREAHEQKELASLRNLFANLAEVEGGKLRKVK